MIKPGELHPGAGGFTNVEPGHHIDPELLYKKLKGKRDREAIVGLLPEHHINIPFSPVSELIKKRLHGEADTHLDEHGPAIQRQREARKSSYWDGVLKAVTLAIASMNIILYIHPCLEFGQTVLTQAIFLAGGCGANFGVALFFVYSTLLSQIADPLDDEINSYLYGEENEQSSQANLGWILIALFALAASMPFVAATVWPAAVPAQYVLIADLFAKFSTLLSSFFANYYSISTKLWPALKGWGVYFFTDDEADRAYKELLKSYCDTMEHYFDRLAKSNEDLPFLFTNREDIRQSGQYILASIAQRALQENANGELTNQLKNEWQISLHQCA